MKARIRGTQIEVEVQAYFPEGMFAGFTDVSGRLTPGMVVYKTSDLEFIETPDPLTPTVDWSAFRREAAKDILCAMVSHTGGDANINRAIELADELIKQLKEDEK